MCNLGLSCLVEGAMPVLVTLYDSGKEGMHAIITTHCDTRQLQTFSEEGDVDLSLEEVDQTTQSVIIINLAILTSCIIHEFSIMNKGHIK